MVTSPEQTAPRINARCEIDLSPGTQIVPWSRLAGRIHLFIGQTRATLLYIIDNGAQGPFIVMND